MSGVSSVKAITVVVVVVGGHTPDDKIRIVLESLTTSIPL
jgi:hypothetical protein